LCREEIPARGRRAEVEDEGGEDTEMEMEMEVGIVETSGDDEGESQDWPGI
jgi:hypothetical protein